MFSADGNDLKRSTDDVSTTCLSSFLLFVHFVSSFLPVESYPTSIKSLRPNFVRKIYANVILSRKGVDTSSEAGANQNCSTNALSL